MPNYHSQGIGLVPGAAWFYIKCFVKFMHDGKAIGTLEKTEKNKVVVNYGVFTSKVRLQLLEFVECPK
jgi:hypothetical protein